MLAEDIRKRLVAKGKGPKPVVIEYVALMCPTVIVPDNALDPVVIADAGSIVKLLNQRTLYRDRVSPITRRADEKLVEYGKADKPKLGWMLGAIPTQLFKPSKGPTFLVNTKSEDGLSAWERMRLAIARTRKSDPSNWFAPWLVTSGAKHPQLVREVTREFGGKPVKNEAFDVRAGRLFQLILKTELDMKTAKSSKVSKKTKSKKQRDDSEDERPAKAAKKSKKEKSTKTKKVSRVSDGDKIGRDKDDYIIKRLIQENPRREGTHKYKIWSRLKKGMTVKEFADKGDGCSRTEVRAFVRNGWVKLLRPKAAE